MGFPTPHRICESCITIRFAFLAGSGVVVEEVSIGTVKPNMAGLDQIETRSRIELPVKNIN
jgi:hypothetical protein